VAGPPRKEPFFAASLTDTEHVGEEIAGCVELYNSSQYFLRLATWKETKIGFVYNNSDANVKNMSRNCWLY